MNAGEKKDEFLTLLTAFQRKRRNSTNSSGVAQCNWLVYNTVPIWDKGPVSNKRRMHSKEAYGKE